jgi:hypothetical protein
VHRVQAKRDIFDLVGRRRGQARFFRWADVPRAVLRQFRAERKRRAKTIMALAEAEAKRAGSRVAS